MFLSGVNLHYMLIKWNTEVMNSLTEECYIWKENDVTEAKITVTFNNYISSTVSFLPSQHCK